MTKKDWIMYYTKVCGYDYMKAEKLAKLKMKGGKINERR